MKGRWFQRAENIVVVGKASASVLKKVQWNSIFDPNRLHLATLSLRKCCTVHSNFELWSEFGPMQLMVKSVIAPADHVYTCV